MKSNTSSSIEKTLILNEIYGSVFQDYIHFPIDNMSNIKESFNVFLVNKLKKTEKLLYKVTLGLNREYDSKNIRIEKSQSMGRSSL